jgi:hypothetical protein
MNTMASTRPTELLQRRVRLARVPSAAAEARSQVRAAVRDWRIPVDPDIAVLLTSDMVTDVVRNGEGDTITLAIRCSRGHLRIDIHEASRPLPMAVDEPADTKTAGRGLVLVAALSAEWGSFRTPAGMAVYFTLVSQSDLPRCAIVPPQGTTRGDCEPLTPVRLAVPTSSTFRKGTRPMKGQRGYYAQESA